MNVTLRGVKLRGVLSRHVPRHRAELPSSEAAFYGRWLVIAGSGECLMDYVHGPCDVERELPLANLCSLASAIQQFIDTACRQGEDPMTHAVTFDSFQLAICANSNLSVVAVVATQKAASVSTAVLRYKAREVHALLTSGDLGEAFGQLVGAAAEARAEKVSDYTLSSCLAEDDSAVRLPKELAGAAQEAFATAFSTSYQTLLEDALARLEATKRDAIRCLACFDSRFEFLARVPIDYKEERLQLLVASAKATMAGPIGDWSTLWTWPAVKVEEVAVIRGAAPLFVAAIVELKEEETAMALSNAGSMVRRVLPEEVELHKRSLAAEGMLDTLAEQLTSRMEAPAKSSAVVESAH